MKKVEITVSKSRKVNTGNYESRDYFVSVRSEIEITDDVRKVAIGLYDDCEQILLREIEQDKK